MKARMGMKIIVAFCCVLLADSGWADPQSISDSRTIQHVKSFPDLSGLAWVEGDTFLAVHDAKNPEELDRPRVNLLKLPQSLDGIAWTTLSLSWPGPLGPSGDLESIARIPGTDSFLLVESGEGRHPPLLHVVTNLFVSYRNVR